MKLPLLCCTGIVNPFPSLIHITGITISQCVELQMFTDTLTDPPVQECIQVVGDCRKRIATVNNTLKRVQDRLARLNLSISLQQSVISK
jgi:hypothetical protein